MADKSTQRPIKWSLIFKKYRAIVDRGRFYHVVHVERLVNEDGEYGDFRAICAACKKDVKGSIAAEVFRVRGVDKQSFKTRKACVDYAVGLADAELHLLLEKVA